MYQLKSKLIGVLILLSLFALMLVPLAVQATNKPLPSADDRLMYFSDKFPVLTGIEGLTTYTPEFDALNIKESMTLTPIFTPDNALDVHKAWIDNADHTIDIQNPYFSKFDSGPWATDSHPVLRAIVEANQTRGVDVRIQMNDDDDDSDPISAYFESINIAVRWMGSSGSSPDGSYLSTTHNKLVIIDGEVVLISSINFSEQAFTRNREAGMVIQSTTVADHFTAVFEEDWEDGEVPTTSLASASASEGSESRNQQEQQTIQNGMNDYPSHTNLPDTNFTGNYNVTVFTNPDNADEVIFRYLESAKESIYVSMYTISRPEFNNTLIQLKKANPSMDIQVLISEDRVGSHEDEDTFAAAQSLVDNLIPVYNSTTDDDKVDGYYHNKYWCLDQKHVFVYSGNWSPRSTTPQAASYGSGDPNRDMGIAVHDAPDVVAFFKNVWDQDVAVGSAWELPVGVKQTGFSDADVLSGTVSISGQVAGLEGATVSYRWDTGSYTTVTATAGSFSADFDTTSLPNGIHTLEVKAEKDSQTFSDSVKVNVANYAPAENWRVLITEVLPDPQAVSDAEGEFIELTNSFPFAVFIGKWQIGDDKALHTFTSDYEINEYSSIIIARDTIAFQSAYGSTADFELDFALSNSGDYVQLKNAKGDYVDVVAFGSATAADNSEVLIAPSAGQSLQRTKLFLDTNKATDFSTGSPDPKGTVPNEPLITDPSFTARTDTTEAPLSWIAILAAIASASLLWRKRLNKN